MVLSVRSVGTRSIKVKYERWAIPICAMLVTREWWLKSMITKSNEVVVMFFEDGEPIGVLHENGKREFYRVTRASKQDVQSLLEIPQVV